MNKIPKKSKLRGYAKTKALMDINIKYGDESFSFNLFEELQINESLIMRELKNNPSSYGFLTMLHKKLIRKKKDTELEKDKLYASLHIKAKQNTELFGKVPTKEDISQMVENTKSYQIMRADHIKVVHDCDIIEACVRAFEQRASLLQTISANLRKEV